MRVVRFRPVIVGAGVFLTMLALLMSGCTAVEADKYTASNFGAGIGLFQFGEVKTDPDASSRSLSDWNDEASPLATFIVTNTNDSGAGSLRQAMLSANGSAGLDMITFNIPGGGVKTISPTSGGLPGITSPVIIDGYTQPGASANTLANGNNAVLLIEISGNLLPPQNQGLLITAGGSTVRGLVINRFDNAGQNGGFGIWLDTNDSNVIEGNFIGTDPTGTLDRGNGNDGIFIFNNSQFNTIGGTTPAARNLISGNDRIGILIFGSNVSNNFVQGNFIGTNAAGTGPLDNSHQGIEVGNSPNNTIGGTVLGARNVVSSNGSVSADSDGINIYGATATGNLVQGNFVGTNVTGTAALGNATEGVSVGQGASNNTIGGTAPGARNIISGNLRSGVSLYNGATLNKVEGNFIGTDINGAAALGNGGVGITVNSGSTNNSIGGTVSSARNVISSNGSVNNDDDGININGAGTTGNIVQGNFIGTNAAGTQSLPNATEGLSIGENASNNLVGGTKPGTGNLISGNTGGDGVAIYDGGSSNRVEGNFIGTNFNGTSRLGNGENGVSIGTNCTNNVIGGTSSAARNIISGNGDQGLVFYSNANSNRVEGNFIGIDISGTTSLGNNSDGVLFVDSASSNTIGGTADGASNVIAFNGNGGVVAVAGTGNRILGNSIFGNVDLGIDLGSFGVTPNDAGDPDPGPNNLQNFPVLTSAVSAGGSTTVAGTLNSTASTTFRVEFFSNSACDSSGNGEGQTLLGSTAATTVGNSASINIALPIAAPVGHFVTATATDAANNTSEFSQCLIVTASPGVQVSGRVTTPTGLGLRNAVVALTDSQGVRRTATTSSFGNYTFENVRSGENYIIGVSSKRYRFAARTMLVNGSLSNVDFIGLE